MAVLEEGSSSSVTAACGSVYQALSSILGGVPIGAHSETSGPNPLVPQLLVLALSSTLWASQVSERACFSVFGRADQDPLICQ